MIRSVRNRILALLTLLTVIYLTGFFAWRSHEAHRAHLLGRLDRREKARDLDSLIALKGASVASIAQDYTTWDEMCRFLQTHDRSWAAQNLDSSLATYDIDGTWVYALNGREVYGTCSAAATALRRLPVTPSELSGQFAGTHFCHFFLTTKAGILEIRGATITTSQDTARKCPNQGYFLAGRLWDADYARSLQAITGATAVVKPLAPGTHPDLRDDPDDDVTDYYRLLPGPDGRPVALLHLSSLDIGLLFFRHTEAASACAVTAFPLVLLGLLATCILRWVSVPLNLLTDVLNTKQSGRLRGLASTPDEFGELARLMNAFFAQQQELKEAHDGLERHVAQRTQQLAVLNRKLSDAYDATIEGWARALDLRDHETEGHSRRVTEMTVALARSFGLPPEDEINIRRGALLHDIGKMGVPDAILLKPGPLTDEERALMRRHTEYAQEMLMPVEFLRPALDIPYCHHERWDGTGYPRGLAGECTPLSARLFAVVDVWDALCSDRPYRRAWPEERVRAHIAALAGSHFDPHVVEVFLRDIAPASHRHAVRQVETFTSTRRAA